MKRKWQERKRKNERLLVIELKAAAADSRDTNGLSTNQWLSIIGIGATLLTTYVKREDIKAFFGKEQATAPELAPVVTIHESPQ